MKTSCKELALNSLWSLYALERVFHNTNMLFLHHFVLILHEFCTLSDAASIEQLMQHAFDS